MVPEAWHLAEHEEKHDTVLIERGELAQVLALPPGSELRKTYDYWLAQRKGQAVPYRSEIDPFGLKDVLRDVFLVEWLDDGDFFYRVVGGSIVDAIGFDVTMKRLSECATHIHIDQVHDAFSDVVTSGKPRFDIRHGLWRGQEWKAYKRMLLPLSHPNGKIGYLLGCIAMSEAADT